MDREDILRMWNNIKSAVKESRSSRVLRVQRTENGEVCEYNTKEKVEQVVQEKCEARFTIAHRAPVMKHSLSWWLRYLEDEDIAKAIMDNTYNTPPELDEATKYILQEIGRIGKK